MSKETTRYPPGRVRDAIVRVMQQASTTLEVKEIERRVVSLIGPTPTSSVRSYLRLNTPVLFVRQARGSYSVRTPSTTGVQRGLFDAVSRRKPFGFGRTKLFHGDCFD